MPFIPLQENDASMQRPDGSQKGMGFLGPLKFHDGRTSTELSVGVNINGKETDIPALVPTLSKDEISYLLSGGKPTDSIVIKARQHAEQRIKQGKSVFAGPDDYQAQQTKKIGFTPLADADEPTIAAKRGFTPIETHRTWGKAAQDLASKLYAPDKQREYDRTNAAMRDHLALEQNPIVPGIQRNSGGTIEAPVSALMAASRRDAQPTSALSDSTEVARQLVAGAVTRTPEMVGSALNWWAPEGSEAERLGKVAKEYWKEKGKGWEPDLKGRGVVASTLIEGAAQVAPSVLGMAAAAVNPIVGGTFVAMLFGGQQAQETYDKGIAAGLPPEEATQAAYRTGLIEGFGETIADVTGAKLLSGAGKAIWTAWKGTAAGAAKAATSPQWAMRFAKDWTANATIQSATEYGQGYGEAAVEKAYGVDTQAPSQAGAHGARVALGMSALLGIPSAVSQRNMGQNRAKIGELLNDPNAPEELRIGAAKFVASDISRDVGKEKADQWLGQVTKAISTTVPADTAPSAESVPQIHKPEKADALEAADLLSEAKATPANAPAAQGFTPTEPTQPRPKRGPTDEESAQMAKDAAAYRKLQEETQTKSPPPAPPGAPTFTPEPGDVPTAPRHAVAGLPVQEMPLNDLKLSGEVPQFKKAANAAGIVMPLGGNFDRTGVAPIQVWERLNGDMEIISGRHRFDLAKRSGEETLPAQIHREADGFNVRQAARLDAELNIRDEQGGVSDYASYFKNSAIAEKDADAAGLLARPKGKAGFAIARDAGEDVFASHSAGIISDEAALAISRAAPGDNTIQAVGLKMVNEGKSITLAENTMRAISMMQKNGEAKPEQGDIFGFDDSAIREAEAMAKRAAAAQRAIREQLASVSGATKRPEIARKLGVDVKDPEAVKAKIAELHAAANRLANWPTHPDLVKEFRGVSRETEAKPAAKAERRQTHAERRTRYAAMSPDELRAELEAKDRRIFTSHLTGLPNKAAYEEVAKMPVQAFADIDGLKGVNDTLGHDVGDVLIQALAGALKKETNQAFHISGDEFYVQGETVADVEAIMNAALKTLSEQGFEYTAPDGTVITKKGMGFSYGTGKDIKSAEERLYADKQARKELGLRTERADTPAVAAKPAAGRKIETEKQAVETIGRADATEAEKQAAWDVLHKSAEKPTKGITDDKTAEAQQNKQIKKTTQKTLDRESASSHPAAETSAVPPIIPKNATSDPLKPYIDTLIKRKRFADEIHLGRKLDAAINKAKAAMQSGTGTPADFTKAAKWFRDKDTVTEKALLDIADTLKGKYVAKAKQPEKPKYETGVPVSATVYHGSDHGNISRQPSGLTFFTDDKAAAKRYGKNVAPVQIQLKNPLVIDYKEADDSELIGFDIQDAMETGHDGIVALNTDDGKQILNQFVVFKQPAAEAGKIKGYAGQHRPVTTEGGAARLDDLTPAFGEDIYGKDAAQFFGTGDDTLDQETLRILTSIRGNPDALISVYRAVPRGEPSQETINPGDWVSVNKKYAAQHGQATLRGKYKIIEQKVRAADLTTNADSFHEQGYYPKTKETDKGSALYSQGQATVNPHTVSSLKTALIEAHIGKDKLALSAMMEAGKAKVITAEQAGGIVGDKLFADIPVFDDGDKISEYFSGMIDFKYDDAPWGVAVLRDDGVVAIGDGLDNSFEWIEGSKEETLELNGLSTVGINDDLSDESISSAVNYLLDNYGFEGSQVVLVRGTSAFGGQDRNESVIKDPVVEAIAFYGKGPSKDGKPTAFYNPSDATTYFIADNLSADTTAADLKGLVRHEISTHALHLGRDSKEFQSILRQLDFMKGNGNKKVMEAFARVPADTAPEHVSEESLAYLVQHNPELGIVKRVIAWFRNSIRSILSKGKLADWANRLTTDDLQYMAQTALSRDNGIESREGALLYDAPADKFYSQLRVVMRDAPDKIFGNAASVKLWLQANAAKNEIKKDELFWTGITDWFDIQGKVTKADVLAFLDQNGVRVETKVLGENIEPIRLTQKENDEYSKLDGMDERGVLPDNLRERYQTLHALVSSALATSENNYKKETKHGGGNLVLPGGSNYREMVLIAPQAEKWGESDTTHYGDTGGGKAIGWLRMDDRTTADGREALFLEELQSKRGQAIRTDGILTPDTHQDERIALKKQLNEAQDKARELREQGGDWTNPPDGLWNQYQDVIAETNRIDDELRKIPSPRGVPSMPFVSDSSGKATQAYITLSMKHAILDAIERGKDVVTWTTGKQQKDRYSLSKQIQSLSWAKYTDDKVDLFAVKNGGTEEKMGRYSLGELPDVVGKDLAKKISDEFSTGAVNGEYSGLALDVGGEWTDAMYGDENGLNAKGQPSMMTQAVNGIFKQLKIEGKVESFAMPTKPWKVTDRNGNIYLFDNRTEADEYGESSDGITSKAEGETQPGFTITPELRAKVMNEGLPLFSRESNIGDTGRERAPIVPLVSEAITGDRFTLPGETQAQLSQRKIQNAQNRWKVIQDAVVEQGGTITEETNVADAMERFPGRVAAAMLDFGNNRLEPMMKQIVSSGTTLDDVSLLAYAEHAPERNREMAKINPLFPNDGTPGKSGSGMTDQDAADIIAHFKAQQNAKDVFALTNDLRAIANKRLDKLALSGSMSQEQVNAYRAKYTAYVPLKGFEPIDEAGIPNGTGKGFSTGKKIDMRALGRGSRAGQVAQNVFRDYQLGLLLAEKARLGKVVAAFVKANPDNALWTVGEAPKKPSYTKGGSVHQVLYFGSVVGEFVHPADAHAFANELRDKADVEKSDVEVQSHRLNPEGLVTQKEAAFDPEAEIRFIQDSTEMRIQLTDPLMLRGYNNLWHPGVSGALEILNAYNGWLRQMYTQKNPAWFVLNIFKDIPSAAIYSTGEYGAKVGAKVFANIPKSLGAAWNFHHNKSAGAEMDKIIRLYLNNGGYTGFAYVGDIEAQTLKLEGMIHRYTSWGETAKKFKEGEYKKGFNDAGVKMLNTRFMAWIEALNTTFENATRLAVFKSAIDSGLTPKQGGLLAKNASTNFNRRGEWGPNMNAIFLFSNAGIQGTRNVGHALFFSPHKEQVWALMGGMVALGVMAGMMSDDDDDLVDDGTRSKAIVFKFGDTQVSIPMPYGFGFFAGFGQLMAQVIKYPEKRDKIAVKMADLTMNHFSPFGNPYAGGKAKIEGLANLTPTIMKPFANTAMNISPFGGMMYPESPFGNKPDSEKAWRNTRGTTYDITAKWLNSITGGDVAQEGMVSVSPETLKLGVNVLFGGAGRLATDSVSLLFDVPSGNAKAKNIPVVKNFYQSIDTDAYMRRFYDKSAEANDAYKTYRAYIKAGDRNAAKDYKIEERVMVKMGGLVSDYNEKLADLRKQEDKIKMSSQQNEIKKIKLDKIDEKRRKIAKRFNAKLKEYNK